MSWLQFLIAVGKGTFFAKRARLTKYVIFTELNKMLEAVKNIENLPQFSFSIGSSSFCSQ